MLDTVYGKYSERVDVLFDATYAPSDVWTPSELTVLFHPWHGGGRAYQVLQKRLTARNRAVLPLLFHDQILTHDTQQVLESFQTVQSKVSTKLQELAESGRYTRTSLFAASLGTPALAMTATAFRGFDRATLLTPGSNLATCMWEGRRTQAIRDHLERQGETLADIDEVWQPIAPVNHVAAFKGKELTAIVSGSDKIIPTKYQDAFADAVLDADINARIYRSSYGHHGTIGRYCLLGNIDSL